MEIGMTGAERQRSYYKLLADIIETPLYVAKNWKNGNKWTPGKQSLVGKFLPIDHRTVGVNEIVFDWDAATFSQNARFAQQLSDYLTEMGIPFYNYWSGNKSIHQHIFLHIEIFSDESKTIILDARNKGCDVMQELRLALAYQWVEQAGIPNSVHGKILDSGKMKWNALNGKTTLIRSCGGNNAKMDSSGVRKDSWKTFLPKIPVKKLTPIPYGEVEYPVKLDKYEVQEGFIVQTIQKWVQSLSKKQLRAVEPVNFDGKYVSLSCMEKLLEDALPEGQRNKGAKIVAVCCKLDNLTIEQCEQMLERYVGNCVRGTEPYTLDEALGWAKWIYSKDPFFNHGELVKAGTCDLSCAYHAEQYKKEMVVFDVDDPLSVIKDALDILVEGEDDLKMTLFLLYLTKEFNPEWCILLDGDAASGKSHTMKAVASLFGEEDEEYFVFSRMTAASLNYLEELAPRMDKKIVIVEELQGATAVVEQLRVAISEGWLKLLLPEEVKEGGVTVRKTVSKKIDMRNVLFVTCNAEEYDSGDQLKSRAWILNTDITEKQTAGIIKRELLEFGLEQSIEVENIEEIRGALRFLKRPDYVKFPFPSELIPFCPSTHVRGRRDVKKMKSLICAHAFMSQKRRRWYEKDGKSYLIADWRDVKQALTWAGESLNASTQGVGAQDLIHYDMIISHLTHVNAFTREEMGSWCSLKDGRNVLTRLCAAGFFKNTAREGMPGIYEKTTTNPNHLGDAVAYADAMIVLQDTQIDNWAKKHNLKGGVTIQ
jgi:hypothetical protein